jgi:hypothetical protein
MLGFNFADVAIGVRGFFDDDQVKNTFENDCDSQFFGFGSGRKQGCFWMIL